MKHRRLAGRVFGDHLERVRSRRGRGSVLDIVAGFEESANGVHKLHISLRADAH